MITPPLDPSISPFPLPSKPPHQNPYLRPLICHAARSFRTLPSPLLNPMPQHILDLLLREVRLAPHVPVAQPVEVTVGARVADQGPARPAEDGLSGGLGRRSRIARDVGMTRLGPRAVGKGNAVTLCAVDRDRVADGDEGARSPGRGEARLLLERAGIEADDHVGAFGGDRVCVPPAPEILNPFWIAGNVIEKFWFPLSSAATAVPLTAAALLLRTKNSALVGGSPSLLMPHSIAWR